ncbi:unnamed protein product [Clonostachys byssicola]|uniref:Uncharacterized protein n=1 Tax=Clonostachys byssicola TaxID=160290 RepID=A0A9N9U2K8_9HYPO|nr:unnamed protein product [Clonostachys byssicola]
MTTENTRIELCFQDNDLGPFACHKHMLIKDGQGKPKKQKLDLTVRDRDIVFCVSLDASTVCVLHLQCVREDTVAMAQVAIEELLDELKSLDNRNNDLTITVEIKKEDAKDVIHYEFQKFIAAQAEKRGLKFEWMEGGYSRGILRALHEQVYLELGWRKSGAWESRSGRRHGVGSRQFEAKEREERKEQKKGKKGYVAGLSSNGPDSI